MSASTPEILITGAGPVGLTAALELKRRGFHPTIIDNDGEPTPESRALAIHARTLDILEPSGVTEQLLKAGNKVNGIICRENNETILKMDFKSLPHKYNFILTLPQSRTEEILIEALKERGVGVNWFTSLEKLTPGEGGFNCQLVKSNDNSQSDQQTDESTAQILIGADGAHSTVRKALEIPFDGESVPGTWSLADVEITNWPYPFDYAVLNLTTNSPVAFFPLGEGFGRLVSTQPDLFNHLPDEINVTKVIWESNFKISYRQVATYQKQFNPNAKAYLAGDAAHIHSPAGGRGMNLGIEDAATLAYLIEKNRTDQYSAMRHPIGKKVLKFTKEQTSQFTSSNNNFKWMMRYIFPPLLAIPGVSRFALKRLTGLDTPRPEWLENEST